ncbi:unnamed protein product [Cyclocybe aegerita]|uniref:Uncharacterized protein n=1 Tax=Cyclocybe aegerita TaxID=1973307 RepID=A0A8S0VSA0_CYCAE|nr:unnamed protein product [Cyclocybe aegerita]
MRRDPLLALAEDVTNALALSTAPTVLMVNIIPAHECYAWFPGGGHKKIGAKWSTTLDELVNRPYEWAKEQRKQGTPGPLVTSRLLDETAELTAERQYDINWSAASMSGDAIRKAQKEADAVIGQDRLPTFSDRENLPYTNALVMEIARRHPAAPTAGPDCAKKPERFLGPNPEPDPYDVCFGFGSLSLIYSGPGSTRYGYSIPGDAQVRLVLADTSVFLSCAMSLAVFDITKAAENGEGIAPIHKQMTGSIR